MSELRYVPAEEDDAAWLPAEERDAPSPEEKGARPQKPRRVDRPPQSITRVDLVLYLQSLSPDEAICWLEHGRPDRRLG